MSSYRRGVVGGLTLKILASATVAAVQSDAQTTTDHDRQLQQKRDAWYQRQAQQDCPLGPYDQSALEAVRRAFRGERSKYVHGQRDPYNRRASQLDNLKTRRNPKGEGVIVTAWEDNNRSGSTDYSRKRMAWLVLRSKVYAINAAAANVLGLLYDGMPQPIQKRAGLVHTDERGRTMMDQLGFEENTFERRFSGGDPFPTCP